MLSQLALLLLEFEESTFKSLNQRGKLHLQPLVSFHCLIVRFTCIELCGRVFRQTIWWLGQVAALGYGHSESQRPLALLQ